MPKTITLVNYTEQGLKDAKNIGNRVAAARRAFEGAGGRLISFHLTLGAYDAVAISEAPDDESYAALILSIAAQGNIRTTTLKAFNEDETARIAGKVS